MSRTGELLWWLACAAVGLLLCAWAFGLLEGCRGDGKKRQGSESALFSWIVDDPRVNSQLRGFCTVKESENRTENVTRKGPRISPC